MFVLPTELYRLCSLGVYVHLSNLRLLRFFASRLETRSILDSAHQGICLDEGNQISGCRVNISQGVDPHRC
jgi:hypothetical protein